MAGLTDSSGCVYALNSDTSNSNNGIFVEWHYEFGFRLRCLQQCEFAHSRRRLCRGTVRKLLRHLFQFNGSRSELRAGLR